MSDTKTFLPLGAAAQADNEPHRLDYIRADQYDRPVSARLAANEVKAITLAVGTLGPALLGVLALVQVVSCWGQSYELTAGCRLATGLFWAYIVAAVTLAIGTVGLLLWGRLARTQAEIARASITRDRYSNPVPVGLLHSMQLEHAAGYFRAAQDAELAMAPYKQLPSGLDALTLPTQAAGKLAEPAPQAPVEATALVALTPDTEWLPWLLEMPHAMIAGGTGAGKTTLARIALAERLRAGYSGIVVDPKGKEWYGLPVVGGGRKFSEILGVLEQVHAEMARRFEAYGAGERSFEPLVIVVDEVPDIMDACLDERRRLVDGRWSRFVRQLGSLAREVQISVILLTQSPLVEDIGMNSAMRKNFTRVALGDEAPILIREEREAKRRAALQELLRGQAHPTALYRRGEVHLLDVHAVPDLSGRTVLNARGWATARAEPSDKAARVAAYRAKIRRMGDAEWRAEVQRLATAPGDRRGGYRFTIEQIRALVGRDQNTVAELCKEARQRAA